MWFRKKSKVSSSITIELLGNGDDTDIVVSFEWPNEENFQVFRQMLDMLNRGKLAAFIAKNIIESGFEGNTVIAKELYRITENNLNRGDKPVAVIPPNQVTHKEIERMHGNV